MFTLKIKTHIFSEYELMYNDYESEGVIFDCEPNSTFIVNGFKTTKLGHRVFIPMEYNSFNDCLDSINSENYSEVDLVVLDTPNGKRYGYFFKVEN